MIERVDTREPPSLPDHVRAAMRGARVGLRVRSMAWLVAALREAEALGTQLVVLREAHDERAMAPFSLDRLVRETDAGLAVDELRATRPSAVESWLGVFTSGTTGEPKLVEHCWARVRAPAAFARARGGRWLVAYEPTSFAGLQVLFSAIEAGGVLVRAAGAAMPDVCRAIAAHGVDIVSATPTFWRLLVAAWPADVARPRLRQATFGGEWAPQATLELVRDAFAPERLTTIYASTETGTALVVSDGREGFPARWLEASDRPVSLRIRDGRLELRSPFGMRGYFGSEQGEGWFRTPDRVEVRGDRIVFLGRADALVNVGGAKVSVEEVEHELLAHPAVLDARVAPRPSPVLGHVLVADVVLRAAATADAAELRRFLATRLAPHALPQLIRFVAGLEVAPSGKKSRT